MGTQQGKLQVTDDGRLQVGRKDAMIVVAGPLFSGKSTLVSTIADDIAYRQTSAVNLDMNDLGQVLQYKLNNYIGGRITLENDLTLVLYDSDRNNPADIVMVEQIEHLMGAVVVVNSALPHTFYEAKAIIERFKIFIPGQFIIATNPYIPSDVGDKEYIEPWDTEDLRIVFRLGDNVPIMPCDVRSREDVKRVLLALLEHTMPD